MADEEKQAIVVPIAPAVAAPVAVPAPVPETEPEPEDDEGLGLIEAVEREHAMLSKLTGGHDALRHFVEHNLFPLLEQQAQAIETLAMLGGGDEDEDEQYEWLTDETADEINAVLDGVMALLEQAIDVIEQHKPDLAAQIGPLAGRVVALKTQVDGLREEGDDGTA